MRIILCVLSLVLCAQFTNAQWIKQDVNTAAAFRGLSVVNEKLIWASGTGGTVIRTIDGGKKWDVIQVPDAAKLDFRDIEAFDAKTAYILSIGNGDSSRIYKTIDGGKTWKLQFKNTDEKAFFDALACSDNSACFAVSDPVNGLFPVIGTLDGGTHWQPWYLKAHAASGEAAFAASGTCFISHLGGLLLVSGGSRASVYRGWLAESSGEFSRFETGIVSGSSGSGIFSIAMSDAKNGVIVGGNYEKPNEAKDNLAFTKDGANTWTLGTGLSGYRSGVAYVDKKTIVAVGTNGSDITTDGGKTWSILGKEDLNAVQAKTKKAVWAVGAKGLVVKMK